MTRLIDHAISLFVAILILAGSWFLWTATPGGIFYG